MAGGGRRTALLAGIVVAMVAAPAAHAAKLVHDRDTGVLTFSASAGEPNRLVVRYNPTRDEYAVSDAAADQVVVSATGTAPSACRVNQNDTGVICTAARVSAIEATLGDLRDTLVADASVPIRVNGGNGDDSLETSRGADSLDGGAGADTLLCGDGLDSVVSDPADSIDASCDTGLGVPVANPAPPVDPGPGNDQGDQGGDRPGVPTGPDGTRLAAPDIVLPVRPVTLGAPGIVQVELGCAAEAAAVCSGDIYVEAPARYLVRRDRSARAARGSHALRQRRLGQRRFRVEPGKTATTSVPVLRGHYILRNRRKRVRGRVLIVQRDAAGKVLGTISRPVVLERKWSRRATQRRR